MSYEKNLQKALKIAKSINYEPIYGSRGGRRGAAESPVVSAWILATGIWRDVGIWIDTENWID